MTATQTMPIFTPTFTSNHLGEYAQGFFEGLHHRKSAKNKKAIFSVFAAAYKAETALYDATLKSLEADVVDFTEKAAKLAEKCPDIKSAMDFINIFVSDTINKDPLYAPVDKASFSSVIFKQLLRAIMGQVKAEQDQLMPGPALLACLAPESGLLRAGTGRWRA